MDELKLLTYESRKADATKIWLLFLFLGWSYGSLGQPKKQIAFYLTIGGLGLWTLYRLVTLNKAIRNYNKALAVKLQLDVEAKVLLNLL